jgi:hypothetical protein
MLALNGLQKFNVNKAKGSQSLITYEHVVTSKTSKSCVETRQMITYWAKQATVNPVATYCFQSTKGQFLNITQNIHYQ